jgi:hypothetical protein
MVVIVGGGERDKSEVGYRYSTRSMEKFLLRKIISICLPMETLLFCCFGLVYRLFSMSRIFKHPDR